MFEIIQNIDANLMLFIQNNLRSEFLNPIMIFFTTIGNTGAVWLIFGAVLMITKKYRKIGLCVILSVSLCYVFNDMIIEQIVQRPRQFLSIEGLNTLVSKPSSFSFPSGHACAGFASSYTLTKMFGQRGAAAYILAVIIAFSRPYVGVHYVSDILVGAVVGTVGSIFLNAVLFPKFNKSDEKQ